MTQEGHFYNVIGLHYRCGPIEGVTTTDYKFLYEPGEVVSFSIGHVLLGECGGKPLVTASDLAAEDAAEFHPGLVNRARLLYSLCPGQGFERPLVIDDKVRPTSKLYSHHILNTNRYEILLENLPRQ
jgi:hypothetical protein